MFQVLRMSGKPKVLALDIVLIDGRRNQYVHISGSQGGSGGFERIEGGASGFGGTFAGGDGEIVRADIYHIDSPVAQLLDVIGVRKLYLRQLQSLAVERYGLCVGKNNRGTQFEYPVVFHSLEYHFEAYAVGVALSDGDSDLILHLGVVVAVSRPLRQAYRRQP